MSNTRYASVLGLGFGDCGKGRFVDALTRCWKAHTVVRCNGGAQAGHNVIATSAAGPCRHHTFSQFGAGTFVPGVYTLLMDPMVLHPTAMLVEAEALARVGVHDALSRILLDARCRITTPYHQAAGRLRELLRGAAAHGSCGVGVGETVRHSIDHPEQVLRYADLSSINGAGRRSEVRDQLQTIRQTLLASFSPQCAQRSDNAGTLEFRTLQDETLGDQWLTASRALARHCPPATEDEIHTRLAQPGAVIFEGAQGVLLDEWRGFHPHTTWSSINTAAIESVASRFGILSPIRHLGVLRSYVTRHGAGPLPTHDARLDAQLPEPHNSSQCWQGGFRRGHPDAVLLRYALEAAGNLSGLLISHLDVFQQGLTLRWGESYLNTSQPGFPRHVERLPLSAGEDLAHQNQLTCLLQCVQPQYAAEPIASAGDFLDRLATVTSLPILLQSYGVTDKDLRPKSSESLAYLFAHGQ